MLDLIQITNDAALAGRCAALPGMRLMVDLERLGKAERQAGRNTFISTHQIDDVGRIKPMLRGTQLMVRVNPLNPGTAAEIDAVLAQGADALMLPMFEDAATLRAFCALVAQRVPVTALLETAGALYSYPQWLGCAGLAEVFVGLNDLHVSLGQHFMFEPLAQGLLEPLAQAVHVSGLRFGFGGIARLDEGLLPGRDVLAEHLRLGSRAVILSRTFHRSGQRLSLEQEIAAMRGIERELMQRTPAQVEADRVRIAQHIAQITGQLRCSA